jgi:hypothetical protein
MAGKTRIVDMVHNKNINIKLNDAELVFDKLRLDIERDNLMDLKKAIFKFYGISNPEMTVKHSQKTLAQQKPNNAYGVAITDSEIRIFMDMFGLTENDYFQESIGQRIVHDILASKS